jgi:hypothetical protein
MGRMGSVGTTWPVRTARSSIGAYLGTAVVERVVHFVDRGARFSVLLLIEFVGLLRWEVVQRVVHLVFSDLASRQC